MAVFDTPTPYVTDAEFADKIIELQNALDTAKAENLRLEQNMDSFRSQTLDYQRKIKNVEGVIRDYYSENGEVSEELTQIAELLEITITKRISGTATFEISWSASVPLDFDADDFEISFDVDCESYEADDFEWHEESTEVNGEDDDY